MFKIYVWAVDFQKRILPNIMLFLVYKIVITNKIYNIHVIHMWLTCDKHMTEIG